ncbi:MAG: hypothetical protein IMY69_08165 [Bacteroidetes bacterium]|nr:hypothetical protein [Bacteroidota bacterium]
MKYFIISFFLFLIVFFVENFLFPGKLLAQDETSPIQFHGSNRAFGQYASRQGTNSQIPASFWRNDLNMTLTVYGIPISSSFFITSEQSDYRQSINNFRIYFDLKAMAINKAKAFAKNKAKGLANEKPPGFMRFLSNFSTFEVGKCRPNYSNLTLKGISVSGVNIEFTPGKFYAAFSTGKVKRPIKPSEIIKPTYKQKLLFGKIGVGKKRETHLYLTFMHVEDEVKSLPASPEIDTFNVKPQSNFVLGTEGKLSLFKKKFTVEGEAAVSLFTRDMRSPALIEDDTEVPSWLTNYLKPNASSSIDYAYNVKSTLKLKTTKLSGGVKMIGAGFSTLGNPNLINDRLTYDGRIDQTFAKKKLSFSAYFKQNKDNLINWKKATTTTTAYGITAVFRFKKIPYLHISYTPNFQKTDSDSLNLKNSVKIISASTGYNYPIGKLKSNTSFSFFYQNTETIMDTITNLSKTQTYTLNEVLTFKIPLSIAAAASLSKSEFSGKKRDILSLTLSGTHRAFKKKWKNTLGVRYLNQIDEQKKVRIFCSSRMKLWKGGDLDIRVEENIFRNKTQVVNNFDEFIARAALLIKW